MLEWVLAAATVLGTVFAGLQFAGEFRRPKKPLVQPPAAPEPAASADDAADWALARRDDTAESYDVYLANHPKGFFSDQAGAKRAALTSGRVKVVTTVVEGDEDGWTSTPTPRWLKPLDLFADDIEPDNTGPEMVVVPSGSFMMGIANLGETDDDSEQPAHLVTIAKAFAVSRCLITFDEWDAFHATTGARYATGDEGWGRVDRPAIKITWERAKAYVEWLADTTDQPYRLLSEAEWEYCCRAGTDTQYSMGDHISKEQACFGRSRTSPVGNYPPNAFGLHDMHGNVWEWCEDAWHDDYSGATVDGSPWIAAGSARRVLRGGGYDSDADELRSRSRSAATPGTTANTNIGFRVARDLTSDDASP